MRTFNIHEARTQLSRLVELAAAGEEIVIAKAGRPMARLVPVQTGSEPRTLGLLAGRVSETEGWWLPDDTPFDRVLIAQARLRGLRLATRDPIMNRYDVPLLEI